ncbi:MAG: antibiotic biosynthesis monooxygenase [Cyclobacteriaceae bacterium]
MEKYGLIGGLKAAPGKAAELVAILTSAADLMRKADGCLLYLVGFAAEDDHLVEIVEVWDSKEDHDASLSFPGVKELIAEAMPLLDGSPEKGIEIRITGGHGL